MTVRFASVNDVKEFVGLASLQSYAVHVLDGDQSIDAKSFMQMFTIDFAQRLTIEIEDEENLRHFSKTAARFLAV